MAHYYRVYASAADAAVTGSSATYSVARSSTAATGAAVTTATIGQEWTGSSYGVYQYFPVFDTTSIPVGEIIAQLSLFCSTVPDAFTSRDLLEVRAVSSVTNKIAGASLNAQTPYYGVGAQPTAFVRFTISLNISSMPRSAACQMLVHSQNERNNVAPTGLEATTITTAERTGTSEDPYLDVVSATPWVFVGVSNTVEVTTTAHALVTTGISGTLAAGDLLVACISSRIASTTSITLPTGGEWTLVSEAKNNNILATGSAAASGMMAYCVRGASNPNLTFTHPVAPSVALGRLIVYRNVNTSSPKDTQTAFTTPVSTTAVSGTGLTTTQDDELIVAMCAGGQEAAWSNFNNVTTPIGSSGTDFASTDPPGPLWRDRGAYTTTTTGVDTSIATFDAVRASAGATGNLTATASVAAAHVVIAGAFKLAGPAGATGTGTPAGQAGAAGGAGISGSAGAGTPAAQAAAVSGSGDVGSAAATGTGAIAADAAAVSGSGVSASVATGTLAAQAATAAGAGVSGSSGAGALAAQAATASGAGAVASIGSGALAAQAATVAGSGLSSSVGTGALQAAAATVVGAGASASAGTGSLVAGSAEVAGTGTAAAANSGVLVAQAATVTGLGVSASTGSGTLQAGAATVAGAGLVASVGSGALVAGPAAVAGAGEVIAVGAAVGTGALVAGAATVSGEGEVTSEVAPPVSVGGGYWRPYRRPVAIEGIGYGILPQVEGEAFGLVVVAGTGALLLSPVSAAPGVGAVGVAGRSTARLAVKAAAVGARGQAGAARAVLKGLSVAGVGVAGVRGVGSGVVLGLKGAAIGRHDDDEAAIMALLLAA